MSTLDNQIDMFGNKKAYAPRAGASYYYMRHRYDRILSELRSVVEPYVECGYDAHQIQDELKKQGMTLVLLNNIETVISTIIGEQS